ncbi:E3 ubiquitin-protein ligase RMA1H1 [Euphorbia lathyris]|uniref:E3 ubiquitin-protein ligase RMA1H1 n=1 Tax=Euphorbia lathyris TaxID=212925 RepID=UPI003313F711
MFISLFSIYNFVSIYISLFLLLLLPLSPSISLSLPLTYFTQSISSLSVSLFLLHFFLFHFPFSSEILVQNQSPSVWNSTQTQSQSQSPLFSSDFGNKESEMDTLAREHYIEQTMAGNAYNRDQISQLEKWKSIKDTMVDSDETNSTGFDCNICLDSVQDPVVTLCGHLYCWPCIYKWLHFQTDSSENEDYQQQQQCPVCKAEVSEGTLVPLFGRGQTTKPPPKGKAPNLGIIIPRRPLGLTCGFDSSPRSSSPFSTSSPRPYSSHRSSYSSSPQRSPLYYSQTGSYTASPMLTPRVNMFDPVMGMFGEMIYARVFGNSVTNIYSYPDSYNLAGNTSPRLRRHVMQADKSLSRICFFLFCCVFLCFLTF